MALQLQGTIHVVFETKQVSERFTKREFVLEIQDGKYPQQVLFQMTGDRVGELDDVGTGDLVDVEFNLRGREWTSPKGEVRYFNSLDVWKLKVVTKGQVSQPEGAPDGTDDIPF